MFNLFALGRARSGVIVGVLLIFVLSCFSSAEPRFLEGPAETSVSTIASSLSDEGIPALLAFGSALVAIVLFATGVVFLMAVGVRSAQSYKRRRRLPFTVGAPASSKCCPLYYRLLVRAIVFMQDEATAVGPGLAIIVALTLSLSPLISICLRAFLVPTPHGLDWSFENFFMFFTSDDLVSALGNSIALAAAVSVLSCVAGFVLSLVVWAKSWRDAVLLMGSLLLIIPAESYSISLLQSGRIFGHNGGAVVLVVLSQFLWTLPFSTGTLILANQMLDRHPLQAAFELGNSPINVITRVIARINWQRIVGVFGLVTTMSLNEYVRASYLGGSLVTVPNVIYGQLASGLLAQNRRLYAAECFISVFSFVVVTGLILLLSRGNSHPQGNLIASDMALS